MGRYARRGAESVRSPQRPFRPLYDLFGRPADQQQRHTLALHGPRLDPLGRDRLRPEPPLPRRGRRDRLRTLHREGGTAEQHDTRHPGGRCGPAVAEHQQGAGAPRSRVGAGRRLLQVQGVAEQRVLRRRLLPRPRREDVLRRRGRLQPLRSGQYPHAELCAARAHQFVLGPAAAALRFPRRQGDRPLARRELLQHPVLGAGVYPQRELRVCLYPQGIRRRLGLCRNGQYGRVHQRAAGLLRVLGAGDQRRQGLGRPRGVAAHPRPAAVVEHDGGLCDLPAAGRRGRLRDLFHRQRAHRAAAAAPDRVDDPPAAERQLRGEASASSPPSPTSSARP